MLAGKIFFNLSSLLLKSLFATYTNRGDGGIIFYHEKNGYILKQIVLCSFSFLAVEVVVPLSVRSFSVLEDDAGGDFFSHSVARNLIESQAIAMALKIK